MTRRYPSGRTECFRRYARLPQAVPSLIRLRINLPLRPIGNRGILHHRTCSNHLRGEEIHGPTPPH